MHRRTFLRRAAAASAAVALAPLGCGGSSDERVTQPVDDPDLAHVLATASHDRLYVKLSLHVAPEAVPVLRVSGEPVRGIQTDSAGRFWAFDARDLLPHHTHVLALVAGRRRLSAPWLIQTLPDPNARKRHVRILAYTCAGGHDAFGLYVPLAVRRRLLQRGLSYKPDVVVANGDHLYWDLRASLSAVLLGQSPTAKRIAGIFDRNQTVLGTANEDVLTRAVDGQIAALYGTLLREIPVFFLRDDHDYFEDDQVTPTLTTFPPDDFSRELARAVQWLYYPEFLPAPGRPLDLPGSRAADRPAGVSESFGTLRWGRLLEALLYDCKGFMQPTNPEAGLVPASVEHWLQSRIADPTVAQLIHMPSNPPGWTAGKYAEWYPDVLVDGALTTDVPKPGWSSGFLAQHDRLLAAASASHRLPLFVSGDIHGQGSGRILRSGALDLSDNPVVSVISGTPGTGVGWPSAARGTVATPPRHLDVEPITSIQELNGFHILDVEPDQVRVSHFRWQRNVDPVEAIDVLEPYHISVHAR
ncbi:MAG: hypothetical protein SF182_15890 [Deltaproteobacteria bacterium]|nr:hypothetical protein [Deltaproteobacteria bacterium]